MELEGPIEEDNETLYRYSGNYIHQNSEESGYITANIINNESEMEDSQEYLLASSTPKIVGTQIDPTSSRFPERDYEFTMNVVSNDTSYETRLEVNESELNFSQTEDGRFTDEWRASKIINETGEVGYNFSVIQQDYREDFSDTFDILLAPGGGETDINVDVTYRCFDLRTNLDVPGQEPLNVITDRTVGAFLGEFFNNGPLSHETDIDFRVTEQETRWTEGDPIGDPVLVYSSQTLDIDPYDGSEYYRIYEGGLEVGNYTARMTAETECSNPDEETDGIDKTYNLTKNFEVIEAEGETVIVDEGEEIADEPFPADANVSGEESDQFLEGDLDEPGTTIDPAPVMSLNIRNLHTSPVQTSRGQFAEINLTIENFADEAVGPFDLEAELDELPGTWIYEGVGVDSIGPDEEVNRSIYMNPEDVGPGLYSFPVFARDTEEDVAYDVEYINIEVTEEILLSQLEVSEAPRNIVLGTNETETLPILITNNGNSSLSNVTAELQNYEECGEYSSETIDAIEPEGQESLSVEFSTNNDIQDCSSLIIISSDQGDYAFSDLSITLRDTDLFIPPEFQVPLIAFMWTAVLLLYSVLMRRYELESLYVKLPLFILVLGESIIFLYLAANYYSFIPTEYLPF